MFWWQQNRQQHQLNNFETQRVIKRVKQFRQIFFLARIGKQKPMQSALRLQVNNFLCHKNYSIWYDSLQNWEWKKNKNWEYYEIVLFHYRLARNFGNLSIHLGTPQRGEKQNLQGNVNIFSPAASQLNS